MPASSAHEALLLTVYKKIIGEENVWKCKVSVVREAYRRKNRIAARVRRGDAIEKNNVALVLPTLRLLSRPERRAISDRRRDSSTVTEPIATPSGRGIRRLRRHEASLQFLAISRAILDRKH